MIVFPNAKINLGLLVTSKRNDGYHSLETIFVPIKGFCDVLEVLTNRESSSDTFANTGLQIDCKPENNLCLKAVQLMREHANIPNLNIHLHKIIPFGAGLAGGSADAAFMLTLLNEQYNVGLTNEKLEIIASKIGADCAVFINNKAVLAKGIGNEFSETSIDLSGLWIEIITPPVFIPTSEAYKNIIPHKPPFSLEELTHNPLKDWKNTVSNDFESSVFNKYPEIKAIKENLYNKGALYASMSGSGSSVYGIFNSNPEISWPKNYKTYRGLI